MSANDITNRKRIFARLWKFDHLNNSDQNPIKAALGAYPEPEYQQFAAGMIAQTWPTDPEVLGFVNDMLNDPTLNDIGFTQADAGRCLAGIGQDTKVDPSYRIKSLDLLCDIQGWKQKAADNNGGAANQAHRPKALVIHSSGSDEDWEKKVAQQQQDLVNK